MLLLFNKKTDNQELVNLQKIAQNDIDNVLDQLRWYESGGDLAGVIEMLEINLRFFRTFIKYHHVLFPNSLVELRQTFKLIVELLHVVFHGIPDECKINLNLERLESYLLEFIKGNTILRYKYELNDSYLSEYMDWLGKNLNYVLAENHSKEMRFLSYLYATEINGYVDHEKLEFLETRIQFMANNVEQFCRSFSTDEQDEDVILDKPPYLLCLIVLVELEMKNIVLGELKASKFTQSRTFKDKKLPKGLSHHLHNLLTYLKNKKLENFPNNVSTRNIDVAIEFLLVFLNADCQIMLLMVGAIAGDVLYVIQKILPSSINKDDTSKINIWSIQILEKTKDLKAQVETYYKPLKFTPSQFPTAGGLCFLESLLRKLNEMSKSKSCLDFMMKPHIGNLEKELSSLTFILEEEFSSLSSIFRDVAKVHHGHKIPKALHRRTINLAYEAEVAIDSILVQYNVLWHIFFSLPAILKEIKHICAEVTEVWSADIALKPCYVIAPSKHLPTRQSNPMNDEEIVGFGNDTEKMIQYLIRGTNELDVLPIVGMGGQGKMTIDRKVYNNDIIVSCFNVRAWCIISQTYNRRELLQEIFRHVMGQRYLIVLDDMWDGTAWDNLRLSFPNVGNRSRIVVTTRLEKVGAYVMHHIDPYILPFLTPEESCQLLQKKVFQQEGCPPELQDVSLAIAKICKGLPPVVVLVAGIIKRKKTDASWWDVVGNSLLSSHGESEGYSLSVVQLSYDKLPDHLRPCLLYMGMFLEDAKIPVSKLISLWIAEGFVQNIESGRVMEEAAEGYLMDLIHSNVVMVSKRKYNGKVKDGQVHDVVLHFCLERSREEKFMLLVKGHYSQFQPSEWKESRVSFNYSNELSKFASLRSKTRKTFNQHLRSLIMTNGGLFHISYSWDPFHQCSKLRLVKVLDLSSHKVECLLSATLQPLIHLKYLALHTHKFDFHPERFPNLETLIVNCYANTMLLPGTFWKMEKLRHVDMHLPEFDKQGIFEESSKLENLRILREVVIEIDWVDVLLGKCPNVQELRIRFKGDRNSAEPFCPTLESLTKLQSVFISFNGSPVPSELHLPSNLKKLVLDMIHESFPLLKTLVINVCTELEEIPLSFANILTRKQIKLMYSGNESLEASVERIKEEITENEECDRLNLIIIKVSKKTNSYPMCAAFKYLI
ncbi:hypothetical protein R3W88_033569 [Solanum pinnatisectum]|uniref:NB-ARC domain-containing protein n=1 Tax=Solanum pinnatisectum TaxID=50273 RepID=A0AAV9K0X6_9SOLN|nr:hypothetical protein R3W88_033569 [Solanum pinnatisectum]